MIQTKNNRYGRNGHVINSVLDLDMYKLTMGQFVYNRYADTPVKYAFKNRTSKVRLADVVDEAELRNEFDYISMQFFYKIKYC